MCVFDSSWFSSRFAGQFVTGVGMGRLLLPLAVTMCAGTMLLTAVALRNPGSSPDPEPEAQQSLVVCFGTVDVEHGVQVLAPLQPGRVRSVSITAGTRVRRGDELIRLDDELARGRVAEAEAGLQVARGLLAQARDLAQRKPYRVAQLRGAVAAGKHRLEAAQALLANQQNLLANNLINAVQVTAARKQVLELESLLQAETSRLAEVEQEDTTLTVGRAEAEAAVAQARVRLARLAVDECILRAPTSAIVLEVLVGPGDTSGGPGGTPAIRYVADTAKLIRVEIEEEFADRITIGSDALVFAEHGRGGPWRGRVEQLGQWYRRRWSLVEGPGLSSDVRTIECRIQLQEPPTLRIGQRVQVRIQERN